MTPTEKTIRDICRPIIDELAERFAGLSGTADDYADYMRRIPDALSAALAVEAGLGDPWGWVIPRGGKKKPVILGAATFDEASAAAEADIHDLGYFPLYRSALTTSPPTPMTGTVGVKPLEWRWDEHRSVWAADSVIGNYIAWSISGYGYFSYQQVVYDPMKAGSSDDDAKAAAQADYEQRILSAITTSPTSSAVEGEAVAWQCRDYADGWINFPSLAEAVAYHRKTGAVMRPASPAPHQEGR